MKTKEKTQLSITHFNNWPNEPEFQATSKSITDGLTKMLKPYIQKEKLPSFTSATLNTLSTEEYAIHTLIIKLEHDEDLEDYNNWSWPSLKNQLIKDLSYLLNLNAFTQHAASLGCSGNPTHNQFDYTILISLIENF